jgi:hypothetical protein
MKEYGCCPKFKKGRFNIYFHEKGGGGATVFLHAHLQVVYYNCKVS